MVTSDSHKKKNSNPDPQQSIHALPHPCRPWIQVLHVLPEAPAMSLIQQHTTAESEEALRAMPHERNMRMLYYQAWLKIWTQHIETLACLAVYSVMALHVKRQLRSTFFSRWWWSIFFWSHIWWSFRPQLWYKMTLQTKREADAFDRDQSLACWGNNTHDKHVCNNKVNSCIKPFRDSQLEMLGYKLRPWLENVPSKWGTYLEWNQVKHVKEVDVKHVPVTWLVKGLGENVFLSAVAFKLLQKIKNAMTRKTWVRCWI